MVLGGKVHDMFCHKGRKNFRRLEEMEDVREDRSRDAFDDFSAGRRSKGKNWRSYGNKWRVDLTGRGHEGDFVNLDMMEIDDDSAFGRSPTRSSLSKSSWIVAADPPGRSNHPESDFSKYSTSRVNQKEPSRSKEVRDDFRESRHDLGKNLGAQKAAHGSQSRQKSSRGLWKPRPLLEDSAGNSDWRKGRSFRPKLFEQFCANGSQESTSRTQVLKRENRNPNLAEFGSSSRWIASHRVEATSVLQKPSNGAKSSNAAKSSNTTKSEAMVLKSSAVGKSAGYSAGSRIPSFDRFRFRSEDRFLLDFLDACRCVEVVTAMGSLTFKKLLPVQGPVLSTLLCMFTLANRARLQREELNPSMLLTLLWIVDSYQSVRRSKVSVVLNDYLDASGAFPVLFYSGQWYKNNLLRYQLVVLEKCDWMLNIDQDTDLIPLHKKTKADSFTGVLQRLQSSIELDIRHRMATQKV